MYRWLWMGSLAAMLVGSTGCLHHNTRGGCSSGNCGGNSYSECGHGSCGGDCNQSSGEPVGVLSRLKGRSSCGNQGCNCGNSGVLGHMGGMVGAGHCNGSCRASGCVAGPLGWQQGGLDYSSHLQPGLLGHNAAQQLNSQPFTPGPPSAQVAYPYYSVRGPRDFLMDNPPSIGR